MSYDSEKIINDITEIKEPKDIKGLTPKELEYLAVKIREFLIDNVSKTGGHLASNLGAVELTLGLHYVFDTPKDKIIWDVGHQAYVHKILTGRGKDFQSLRKSGGLSGFPKRIESIHDSYDTGHSSTSISAALGMASARDIKGEKGEIIAVIGDGSMTGGPAFEALNNIGNSKSKVIIVLNDNGMSISNNIGGISEHLSKLRTSRKYTAAKEKVKGALDNIPGVGPGLKSVVGNTKDNIKYMLLSGGVLFEELGLTYLGPFDGNNIEDVITAFRQAKKYDGSVIIHLITKKGKGYVPAEKDPNKFHGIGAFDIESGKTGTEDVITYSGVFGETMEEIAEENSNVTAITAAMCDATGLSGFMKKFPERIFDVGIAEAHGVIFAAGQALSGLHPVVAIYSSFLQRSYDELMEDICLQNLPVTFAIDRAGIVGSDGETHHGIFDLSYLIPMPNMRIFTPCDGNQLKSALKYAVNLTGPSAIRYPRGEAIFMDSKGLEFNGSNNRLFSGKDVEILAVGTMLNAAMEARNILMDKGIDSGIVNVAAINKDFQLEDYILSRNNDDNNDENNDENNHDQKLIVTIEDNVVIGGFGEYLNGLILNSGINSYKKPDVLNLGWPDKFIEHGSQQDLFRKYSLDGEGIANQIAEALSQ